MILRTLLSHRRRTHNIGQASARETYGNTTRFIKHTLGAGLAAAAVAFAPSAHANPVDEVPCASGDCARECMDVCYDITGDYGWGSNSPTNRCIRTCEKQNCPSAWVF